MQISSAGLNLIKAAEGFKPYLYNCPANDATIGFGHLVHHGPICGTASEVPFAGGISEEQGSALLLEDVAYAEHAVEHLVTAPLSQGQYEALISSQRSSFSCSVCDREARWRRSRLGVSERVVLVRWA